MKVILLYLFFLVSFVTHGFVAVLCRKKTLILYIPHALEREGGVLKWFKTHLILKLLLPGL